MNTKALILICLLGYINSQAMKPVCMSNLLTGRRLSSFERHLQAVKPSCPYNKDHCCPADVFGVIKKEWQSVQKDIYKWYKEMEEFVGFNMSLFADKNADGFRAANWKNNTVCKGKKISPLTRRLQAVQPQCKEATELSAAIEAFGKFTNNLGDDAGKCINETLKVGAGFSCQACDTVAPSNLSWVNKGSHQIYLSHETAASMVSSCGKLLQALYKLNPIINALDKMVQGRRLQAIKPKPPVDYFGFNVDSCMNKLGGRRLQALKKDSVQSHKECADLALWYMNNILMNGASHKLRLNPAMMKVMDKVVAAIGTDKAKATWKNVHDDVRTLQAVKPKSDWLLAFNSDMTGFKFVDHAPKNTEFLN